MKIGRIEKCFRCKELLVIDKNNFIYKNDPKENEKLFICRNIKCEEMTRLYYGFYVAKDIISNKILFMNFVVENVKENIGIHIEDNWIRLHGGSNRKEVEIKLSYFSKFKEMNDDNFLEVREYLIEKFNQLRILK